MVFTIECEVVDRIWGRSTPISFKHLAAVRSLILTEPHADQINGPNKKSYQMTAAYLCCWWFIGMWSMKKQSGAFVTSLSYQISAVSTPKYALLGWEISCQAWVQSWERKLGPFKGCFEPQVSWTRNQPLLRHLNVYLIGQHNSLPHWQIHVQPFFLYVQLFGWGVEPITESLIRGLKLFDEYIYIGRKSSYLGPS